MKNYRTLNTCSNCKFHIDGPDPYEPSYYCNYGNSAPDNFPYTWMGDMNEEQIDAYWTWQIDHRVYETGICDLHELDN